MKPDLKKIEGGSVFRRIAMGSWQTAGDPSVYGLIEIDVTKIQQWISGEQKKYSSKISIAHVVGKAVAKVLQERPEINGLIRFSRIYQRKHVDLFYQVNIPGSPSDPVGKAMLSGEIIRSAEKLSVGQIAEQLEKKADLIRKGGRGELTASINFLKFVPWSLMYWVLNFNAFLTYGLRLNLSWLGLSQDPFGSVMITNVGSLGVDVAWAPLVPYTRVPLLLTVGTITQRPWVVDGKVEVRPVVRIGITFDHRFMDGIHAAEMSKIFKTCFENPEKYLNLN